MRIAVFDYENLHLDAADRAALERLGEVEFVPRGGATELTDQALDAEALFLGGVVRLGGSLRQRKNLKYIGLFSTGSDNVDTALARELGIPVCTVPDYGTHAVAQFTLALLLELCSRVSAAGKAVRRIELCGRTIGIVGWGRIGREVAKLCAAFGMDVLVWSRHPDRAEETAQLRFAPLETVLASSDVVSLHCPLTPETAGLIDGAAIARMKDGAILLNTARGALVDEQALADALRSGRLAAAGLDVTVHEPWDGTGPLSDAPNLIVTPHVAWATEESRRRLFFGAVENFEAWLAGKPQNVVN